MNTNERRNGKMPKLKRDDVADLDVDALDEVEYDDSEFQSYGGEVPPVGTELKGFLKSLWWTRTAVKADGSGDDPMLKALWVAAENEGDEEEYNDCPFWMNLPLIPSAKFRWAPFLDVYGITLRNLKNKTYVSSDEDQFGAPIERIDTFRPGEDSDDAWCRIVSGRERYDGEWQARVKSWLPWDEADEAEPEDEEEPEDGDEEYDDTEDEQEEEEEEQEEQEERPARGRTRSGSRSAQAAPAARPGRSGRSAPARPAAATSARSGRSSGRSAPARPAPARSTGSRAAKADTKPAARGRGRSRSAGSDEDPPF